MDVLYIAYCVPYDKAYNAGAQTLNHYIKKLAKNDDINVDVVAYCNERERKEIEAIISNIKYHLVVRPKGILRFIGRITSIRSKYDPFHKGCNLMTRYSTQLLFGKLKEIANSGYVPDVIFLEWTQIVLFVNDIRRIFPSAKFVASEHDVTYLSFQRKYEKEENKLFKYYKGLQYRNCVNREIAALKSCDHIFVPSKKDKKLVTDKVPELEDLISIQKPFYHKTRLHRNRNNNDIIFFGAMGRIENSMAVKWFITNVMPLIQDLPCRFVVIGSGVTDELKRLETNKVFIKGFVPSIDETFSNAMCFVCPLLLGAGIKVKVLEALYAGIPVLTNQIGIEGIDAKDGIDYMHCEKPHDYAEGIRKIYEDPNIGINGRSLVERDFSLELSFDSYYATIRSLVNTRLDRSFGNRD